MGLLSLFKKQKTVKKPVEKKAVKKAEEPKPFISPLADLPKPTEYTHIQLTTLYTAFDGSLKELPNDTILQDGTCLIPVDGHYYHMHVGCKYKGYGSVKMVTIKEAEKLGYMPCMACEDQIESLQEYNDQEGEDGE